MYCLTKKFLIQNGKRKPVAQGRLNLKDFATHIPSQHNLTVKLRPLSKKERGARNYAFVISLNILAYSYNL